MSNNRPEPPPLFGWDIGDQDQTAVFAKGDSGKIMAEGLNYVFQLCHDRSYNAGWWRDPQTFDDLLQPPFIHLAVPTKLMLTVSELSEAMEGYRKGAMDDKLPHRPAIEVELADAIIRIGDLAKALNLDVGGAVVEKMEYNDSRPDHKPEARAKTGGLKF